jgi:poly(A) polymerase
MSPEPTTLRDAEWFKRPETRRLFQALNTDGHSARAVGGVVRNSLLGQPVHDVDIATTSTPEETIALAERAGLKAVPTGLAHGTVTVVVDHTPFEVTTLRTDVEADGRHARVAFTSDWAADARRRDFTMNALYCDADGIVHDPLGGYKDVMARRVRFIGDASDRIREDYLRILRFFRFSAEYAEGELDSAGLAACRTLRAGLDRLSRERVRAELLRLLASQYAPRVVRAIATDFLTRLLPAPPDVDLFGRMAALEAALGLTPDAVRRLGALSGAHPGCALPLKDALRLSSGEFERLARLALPDPALNAAAPEPEAKAFIYRHGAGAFVDGVLLAAARKHDGAAGLRTRLALPERWQTPEFPVRGSDVVALGLPAGPQVGHVLAALEEWWIEADFPGDGATVTAQLARLVAAARAAST